MSLTKIVEKMLDEDFINEVVTGIKFKVSKFDNHITIEPNMKQIEKIMIGKFSEKFSYLIENYIDEVYIYEIRDNMDANSYQDELHNAYVDFIIKGGYKIDDDFNQCVEYCMEKILETLESYLNFRELLGGSN